MKRKILLLAFIIIITVLAGCSTTTTEKCAAYTDTGKPERGWDYRDYYPNTQTIYYYTPIQRD